MLRTIRIGNAQAFWGDRGDAAAEMLALEPDLDYLTLDYLAEVSMSILAVQQQRDSSAGYARDFVEVVRSLAPYWDSGGRCKLIVNAGGLNPAGCALACRAALEEAGCRSMKIGVVSGDNVLPQMRDSAAPPAFQNLDTGEEVGKVAGSLVTANAYLGSAHIVQALAEGAEIVITGRVADPSLVVGPCIFEFGWASEEFNLLAGATVAGHLIECGTQVTGGISTDWLNVPDPLHLGFPIVEVSEDGSCLVTKSKNTGGCVNEWTVKEQLVYEIGDPARYLSPDVTVSFLSLQVAEVAKNRVRVSGAAGTSPPDQYKVSATYRDGYRAAGMLTIVGRQSREKARRAGEIVLQRVRAAGCELRESVIECLGFASSTDSNSFGETVLRVAVAAESKSAVERFTRELMPLITAGPQGTTGYAEGRPRVHPVVRYWPCLIEREAVTPKVEIITTVAGSGTTASQSTLIPARGIVLSASEKSETIRSTDRRLYDIALARSGDKGIDANIGVIAKTRHDWEFLQGWLTGEKVKQYFIGVDSVERYELANLQALNFVLRGILRQGLQTDAQGKTLGQRLLEMKL